MKSSLMTVILAGVLFITTLMLSATPAAAYDEQGYRWYGNPTFKVASNMGSQSTCDEFSSVSWRNDFNCAVVGWNSLDVSYLAIAVSTNDENDTDAFDSENEVAWDSSLGTTTFGSEWTFYIGGEIYESDITFNPSPAYSGSWVSGAPPPSDWHYNDVNMIAFRQVALHELGHAQGLGHYNGREAVMNSYYPDGGWYRGNSYNSNNNYYGRFWPHADDVAGVRDIYTNVGVVGRDLALLRSWYPGSPAGVSKDVTWAKLNGSSSRTYVCPDEFIRVQYTVENRGNESVGVEVHGYVSSNIWISPTDIKMTGRAEYLLPYESITRTTDIYFMTNPTPGTYHVGLFIDPDNDVTGEQGENYENGVQLHVGNYSTNTFSIYSSSHSSCQ